MMRLPTTRHRSLSSTDVKPYGAVFSDNSCWESFLTAYFNGM